MQDYEIKVLKVNGKRITKKLLEQLPRTSENKEGDVILGIIKLPGKYGQGIIGREGKLYRAFVIKYREEPEYIGLEFRPEHDDKSSFSLNSFSGGRWTYKKIEASSEAELLKIAQQIVKDHNSFMDKIIDTDQIFI